MKLSSFLRHTHTSVFKKLKAEHGFTLVEVMVAVILLSIVTTGVFSGLITASKILFKMIPGKQLRICRDTNGIC